MHDSLRHPYCCVPDPIHLTRPSRLKTETEHSSRPPSSGLTCRHPVVCFRRFLLERLCRDTPQQLSRRGQKGGQNRSRLATERLQKGKTRPDLTGPASLPNILRLRTDYWHKIGPAALTKRHENTHCRPYSLLALCPGCNGVILLIRLRCALPVRYTTKTEEKKRKEIPGNQEKQDVQKPRPAVLLFAPSSQKRPTSATSLASIAHSGPTPGHPLSALFLFPKFPLRAPPAHRAPYLSIFPFLLGPPHNLFPFPFPLSSFLLFLLFRSPPPI